MHWYYLGKSHILQKLIGIKTIGKTLGKHKTEKQNGKREMGEAPYPTPAQPTNLTPAHLPPCSDPSGRYRCSTPAVAA
jgi:hypothetical protein